LEQSLVTFASMGRRGGGLRVAVLPEQRGGRPPGRPTAGTAVGRSGARPARTALVMLLALIGWCPAARAHLQHTFGNAFHPVSLAEAYRLAEEEFKIVALYLTELDGRAASFLERPTWEDWRSLELLLHEAVAIKLDGGRAVDKVERFEVASLPAIVLLNQDGTVRKRFTPPASADGLIEQLVPDLSGPDTVARAREAVEKQPGNLLVRERLAEAFARHGALAEALEHYNWCVDVGLRSDPRIANARRPFVFEGLIRLAARHRPARERLDARWDAMQKGVLADPNAVELARDLAALGECLGRQERLVEIYDRLPARSRGRYILFHRIIDQLVELRRYDEVLRLIFQPKREFVREAVRAATRGTRKQTVARGAVFVEALAGANRVEDARELIEAVLRFDDTAETRALLTHHARRAESPELTSFIESRPGPGAGEKQPGK